MSGRAKKPPPTENHERWLISYADFITLLYDTVDATSSIC